MGESLFQVTLGKKVSQTPSQPIKAECGGMHLSSQLHRKCKKGDHGLGFQGIKCETLSEK
jgi:hypothetical protein